MRAVEESELLSLFMSGKDGILLLLEEEEEEEEEEEVSL